MRKARVCGPFERCDAFGLRGHSHLHLDSPAAPGQGTFSGKTGASSDVTTMVNVFEWPWSAT
jgi:hypothetical protein